MTGDVGFRAFVRLSTPCDRTGHRRDVLGRRVSLLRKFEFIDAKATRNQQLMRILNLILADHGQSRFQVLPQQGDFEWFEHPGSFRGNELPTG